MKTVRVGVIGTGFGSLVQIPGFKAHPGTEVVAVSGVRPGRAAETAAQHGIPKAYNDWRELVRDAEVDLVSIVSAPHLHHPMTMAALEAGKHVLCEKPMAMNVAEAREMADRAQAAGVVNAIDHEFRYQPARLGLKELLNQGSLGEVMHVSVMWSTGALPRHRQRLFGWLWESEKGGGMLGALGSHVIDSLHWWFGPIAEVSGILATRTPELPGPNGSRHRVTADDSFSFLGKFARGGDCAVRFLNAHHGFGVRIEVFGSEGTAVIEDDRRLLVGKAGEELKDILLPDRVDVRGVQFGDKPDARTFPFVVMADHLVAAIAHGQQRDYATFADGVRIQGVMDAIRQSVATGHWQKTNTQKPGGLGTNL